MGHNQKPGVDYEESFAPVMKLDSSRTLIAIASQQNMKIEQDDVETAYLNAELKDDVYLEQPEGFVQAGQENKMKKLLENILKSWLKLLKMEDIVPIKSSMLMKQDLHLVQAMIIMMFGLVLLLLVRMGSCQDDLDTCSLHNMCPKKPGTITNCKCDMFCYTYGDCCSDVPPDLPYSGLEPNMFRCGYGQILVVYRCPSNTPAELKEQCETYRPEYPFNFVPVTDNRTGFVYRSIHCARCNNVSDTVAVYWNVVVHCPKVNRDISPYDQKSLSNVLFYSKEKNDWGIKDDIMGFKKCEFHLAPPALSHPLRFCNFILFPPVDDFVVADRQEKKPRGGLPKMTSGNFVHLP
ncbi:hypothetical protein LAZ67_4001214 [Cordylochernes scorpioides]|uniref:SMB domain-containing protein n=1 Tax=Cordylochernes scorpioides TaxID=51811 RepID=A0ABY6KBY3_9ARAC|nr:hypothetical protein LAZ67_4001214 [Cordylochernes scorpioides]